MTRYAPTHEYQYRAGNSSRTRSSGCTWISGAVGVDASTGGRLDPSPDQVLAKVDRSEETSPTTPGWSLADLQRAMGRMSVPFVIRSGQDWRGVRAARSAGLYIVLQGDSDRFPDGCSGAFDGDHAIGIRPDDTNAKGEWAIDDPICPKKTYESEATLRAYAEKLAANVLFGVFTNPVPVLPPDTSTEDPVDVYSVPGTISAEAPAGTSYYAGPTGTTPRGSTSVTRRYLLVGQSDPSPSPARYLVDGGTPGADASGRMSWIASSALTKRRDESFNGGVDAAAKAAASARR